MFQGLPNLTWCSFLGNEKWENRKFMLHNTAVQLHHLKGLHHTFIDHLALTELITGISYTDVQLSITSLFMYLSVQNFWTISSFSHFEHSEVVIQLYDGILGIKDLLNTVCIYFSALYCHVYWWLQTGFGLIIGFINHLQVVNTNNYYTIVD
jgi:hypothetical protein